MWREELQDRSGGGTYEAVVELNAANIGKATEEARPPRQQRVQSPHACKVYVHVHPPVPVAPLLAYWAALSTLPRTLGARIPVKEVEAKDVALFAPVSRCC